MITITQAVLERGMTPEQQTKIASLYDSSKVEEIFVTIDFSLPTDYVAVAIVYKYRDTIHGGIDGNGVMST